MKTSTEIYSTARHVGEKKAVELLGKAGFDAWDFSMFEMARWDWESNRIFDTPHVLKTGEYLKFARELKSIGQAYGMVCNQSHAPFPTQNMPLDTVKRAIVIHRRVDGGDSLFVLLAEVQFGQDHAKRRGPTFTKSTYKPMKWSKP